MSRSITSVTQYDVMTQQEAPASVRTCAVAVTASDDDAAASDASATDCGDGARDSASGDDAPGYAMASVSLSNQT